MYKGSMICIHMLGLAALVGAGVYIYLNETKQLNRIKRTCQNKVNEVKEDIKEMLE